MLKVIGRWEPPLDSYPPRRQIAGIRYMIEGTPFVQEWEQFVRDCLAYHNIQGVLGGGSSIRPPGFRPQVRFDLITNWHHDNTHGADYPVGDAVEQLVVVWSTIKPTEILIQRDDGQEEVWCAEPYDVVAFTNGEYKHRTPAMTEEERNQRWFGRAYIQPSTEQRGLAGLRSIINAANQEAIIKELINYGKKWRVDT